METKKVKLTSTTIDPNDNATTKRIDDHTLERITYAKLENLWKHINVGLIKQWKVERLPNLINIFVIVNGVRVYPSSKTDQYFIFNFPTLREKWFDLLGNTTAECDLMALEDACMYAQLQAIEHYKKTPKEVMKGCLFTQDLTINWMPEWKSRTKNDNVNKIMIVEQYIISDIHRDTYSS